MYESRKYVGEKATCLKPWKRLCGKAVAATHAKDVLNVIAPKIRSVAQNGFR
jgi:hypothetical protein